MKKITIRDLDCKNKKVFLRVDFNVPIADDFKIKDDTRIVESIPTIKYLIEQNAKIILCSHLGRPDGVVNTKMSLRPVVTRLGKLLQMPINFAENVMDKSTKEAIDSLNAGEILMLENIRFYKEEEKNDAEFSKYLASLADIYVNDAFATMHRKHASTHGIAKLLPNAVGFLVEKELLAFDKALVNPPHPFVAILGGAKISDKIPIIENLIDKVDTILIGGGMSYTFVKAIGGDIGMSMVDNNLIDTAKDIVEKAKEKNVKIILPNDNIASKEFSINAKAKVVNSGFFPKDYQGMDIGPKTIKTFKKFIKKAKIIVWNGPMGVYEFPKFRNGTCKIAKYIAKSKAYSIIGGGDSVASIQDLGFTKKVSHISTGGGASLVLLQGGSLPCLDVINDKK